MKQRNGMKTKEELDSIKPECEDLQEESAELADEELQQVAGGGGGLNLNEGYC